MAEIDKAWQRLNQCPEEGCGHYDWAHTAEGCPIADCTCKRVFLKGENDVS